MTEKFDVKITKATDNYFQCQITIKDRSIIGHQSKIMLVREILVKDKNPVHSEEILFETNFKIDLETVSIPIPAKSLQAYSYQGEMIEIEIHLKIELDDGYLLDTTISSEIELNLGIKPKITHSKELVNPKDLFNFQRNFLAIPFKNKLITIGLVIIGLILISVNTLIGIHDQTVPESQTYFYSQRDSDGDSNSPLMNSLYGSGACGFIVWIAIRNNLRKYMTLNFINFPKVIEPRTRLRAQDIITGQSRVTLDQAILRIVACNYEKGQYIRGSGTKKRTVSFSHPVQGVILFEQRIPRLPAGMEINQIINGIIKFSKMFNTLYPFQMNHKSHGLDLYWEMQLTHEDFI
ncbi:MAG: hypothetical protein WD512_06520, partial [Candidatus Paceibacterota bacterium]